MRQEDCFYYKILIDEYISGHIVMNNIKLIPLEDRDRDQFILDNQEAFNFGALEILIFPLPRRRSTAKA